MRVYQSKQLLHKSEDALKRTGFSFGPNKHQELLRLIYEVCHRDRISPRVLLLKELLREGKKPLLAKQAFVYLKKRLLEKRFPKSYAHKSFSPYLPKIEFDQECEVHQGKTAVFSPQKIFVEKEAWDYPLTQKILSRFKQIEPIKIENLKSCIKSFQSAGRISDYNLRGKSLYLVKEKHDFIKRCPCTNGAAGCGYYVLNLGFGCIYECSYCFLQCYTNAPAIILPVNIRDYIAQLEFFLKDRQGILRIGTGEFTDSLVLDDLTGFSIELINFFAKAKNALLELKTKSNNIENILGLKHNQKTVISWSINPQSVIDADEWQSVNLEERLKAAGKCVDAGYKVGFHFDPIIYSKDWERIYQELVDNLFEKIDKNKISWISLGTFRFPVQLKAIIEQRFPKSRILDEELVLGFDRKLRYIEEIRCMIYKKIFSWIRKYSKIANIYLCMESKEMCEEVMG